MEEAEGIVRGKIRKITIGQNPMATKAVAIDSPAVINKSVVVEILQDKNYLAEFGIEKYLCIAENKQGIRYIWNEVIGLPVVVEYFDPKDEPVNIN